MISYRDMTFCSASFFCETKECIRKLTDEQRWQADEMELPISLADFSKNCDKFEKSKDYPYEL